jgi:hypothetical protein
MGEFQYWRLAMATIPVGALRRPAISLERRPSALWSPRRALAVWLGSSAIAWAAIATLVWTAVQSAG